MTGGFVLDLNYLLHRHQVSLMRAQWAPSMEARSAHTLMAREYRGHIDAMQDTVGAGIVAHANGDIF